MLRIRFGEFDVDARLGELRKGARRLRVPHQSMDILEAPEWDHTAPPCRDGGRRRARSQ